MEKNIGKTDCAARIVAAVVILYFIDGFNKNVQLILAAIAVALIITAINRVCLLYIPFKINTAEKSANRDDNFS